MDKLTNTNKETNMSNVVYVKQNRVLTNSKELAEAFGKQHKDVLRKIEARLPEHSEEFVRRNFTLVSYLGGNNEERPMHELTKDGFMAIAMTFTGKRGSIFREKIIEEFNRRGEGLEKRGIPTYTHVELLEMSLAEIKKQTERADKAEFKATALQDNAAAAVEYGLTASRILAEYPAIAKAASTYKITFNAQTVTPTAQLTCYLRNAHGFSTDTKIQMGRYPITVFDKALLDKLEAELGASNER